VCLLATHPFGYAAQSPHSFRLALEEARFDTSGLAGEDGDLFEQPGDTETTQKGLLEMLGRHEGLTVE